VYGTRTLYVHIIIQYVCGKCDDQAEKSYERRERRAMRDDGERTTTIRYLRLVLFYLSTSTDN
jgi:hypothetical protein